jgi:NADH:ubiquinone oxidoreductase subunit H
MEREPEFTKKIPSTAVCGTYYVIFWLSVALGVMSLVSLFFLGGMKAPAGMKMMLGIQAIVTTGLAIAFSLFRYIVCARALLPEKQVGPKGVNDMYAPQGL